jgi:murein DD-endopeptidase MepM/ murein hydrolase activator NlpD
VTQAQPRARASKGGATVQDTFYRGGRYIPRQGQPIPGGATPDTTDLMIRLLKQQTEILKSIKKEAKGGKDETQRQRNELKLSQGWKQLGILALALLIVGTVKGAKTIYNTAISQIPFMGGEQAATNVSYGGGGYFADDRPLKKGDKVGTWIVTSPRGPRQAPVPGASTNHGGGDLANTAGATEGHPLIAPWNADVQCFTQTKAGKMVGAGHGAILRGGPNGLELRAYHLKNPCQSGQYATGQTFGLVGNTGTGSGAHLHLERWVNGVQQDPTHGDAASVLGIVTGGGGGDFVTRYINAISGQESGHDYSAINAGGGEDSSGALGRYQFMPATMRSVAQNCPGINRIPSTTEFLNTPALQDQIMRCHVQGKLAAVQKKTSDPKTQCRMMASIHYSGNANLWNSTKRQFYGGREYPSIAQYTASVCKNF